MSEDNDWRYICSSLTAYYSEGTCFYVNVWKHPKDGLIYGIRWPTRVSCVRSLANKITRPIYRIKVTSKVKTR